MISNFYIDHEAVRPDYVLKDSIREVVLDYDQTNFGFQFSSDSYHIPEKNRFRYRLRGYNDTWITVDAQNRTAMYSKVPAGVYWFEVYAANNDGVWSDAPTVVKVIRKVAPPQAFMRFTDIIQKRNGSNCCSIRKAWSATRRSRFIRPSSVSSPTFRTTSARLCR